MTRKMKLKISGRLLKKKTRRNNLAQKKHCRFCSSDQAALLIDYKNANMLKSFITERGKILPSRISGTCSKHQRLLSTAIKNARILAMLPFTAGHSAY